MRLLKTWMKFLFLLFICLAVLAFELRALWLASIYTLPLEPLCWLRFEVWPLSAHWQSSKLFSKELNTELKTCFLLISIIQGFKQLKRENPFSMPANSKWMWPLILKPCWNLCTWELEHSDFISQLDQIIRKAAWPQPLPISLKKGHLHAVTKILDIDMCSGVTWLCTLICPLFGGEMY
jgi:hypothetical protein